MPLRLVVRASWKTTVSLVISRAVVEHEGEEHVVGLGLDPTGPARLDEPSEHWQRRSAVGGNHVELPDHVLRLAAIPHHEAVARDPAIPCGSGTSPRIPGRGASRGRSGSPSPAGTARRSGRTSSRGTGDTSIFTGTSPEGFSAQPPFEHGSRRYRCHGSVTRPPGRNSLHLLDPGSGGFDREGWEYLPPAVTLIRRALRLDATAGIGSTAVKFRGHHRHKFRRQSSGDTICNSV